MTRAILLTRPNFDLITNYLFYWSIFVIREANKKGFKVLDLQGNKANKQTFTSYIKKHEPLLVFFNGHGNDNAIAGHDNEILVEVNKNEQLLVEKIVYARSCNAVSKLGPACIKKSTLAFIGYKKKYALGYTPSQISDPLKDKVAGLFLEPSNLIPISLLKGNTAGYSYKKSQEAMWRNFMFMLSTKAFPNQKDAAPYLWANRKYQTILGNPETHM